ncbi:hypothetical protein [Actinophytocola sp.]|uniref:Agd3-related carbohydrate-binding protein n=1 Tax=Actinophytocola sp. TaxID=1872138 RepID=UPI002ED5C5C5
MRLRTVLSKSPGPLLVATAAGLAVVTVLAPRSGGELDVTASRVTPPAPRIEFVPVRRAEELDVPSVKGDKVSLRQLVIATGPDDVELPVWEAVLDRIGTPYDVLLAGTEPLDESRLVRDDIGRYNGILLTSGALLKKTDDGSYVSALAPGEWAALHGYERTFDVRQVALNTAPGSPGEDYCLRAKTEGAVGDSPVHADLTGTGARLFDYLRPGARLPLSRTYVYRTTLAPDCDAEPLLTVDGDVVGVLSRAPDGRERAALTFVLGANLPPVDLVAYGLLRWVTKGVFAGEQRHWLNVDVDDWFAATERLRANGKTDVFRLSGPEVAEIVQQQRDLEIRYPLATGFTLQLAYNGSGLNPNAPAQCDIKDTPDPLTSYSRCLVDEFRWINHTLSHPEMTTTSYARSHAEIDDNLDAAASIGLPVPVAVLKTPEYSGLGVYRPDPRSESVTDFGLAASNGAMLRAASDLGVRYVHGNMSFTGHRPTNFNCGVHHPLRPDILVVPDWPTNIAYEATTPDEQVTLYNGLYGVHGSEQSRLGRDLTYEEIVDAEADLALGHLMSGSAYTHTLHQGNLHVYAPGRSLTFDWLDALLAKYSAYYQVPLRNPDWLTLATYVDDRTSHFAGLAASDDPVWNRRTGSITYTPATAGSLFVTGLETRPATEADQKGPDQAESYGNDTVARLGLTANDTVTLTARPRT